MCRPSVILTLIVFQDNSLIVGGGDNNIHILDMETGMFKVGAKSNTPLLKGEFQSYFQYFYII